MSAEPSISRAVIRAYVASIISVALAIAVVGSSVAAWVVMRRDDASAMALARALGSELQNHAGEPRAMNDARVQHELLEHRWFARRVEVWQAADRIGGSPSDGLLGAWAMRDEGCQSAQLVGGWHRICVIWQPALSLKIVVASPLSPLLRALLPLVFAICGTALAMAAVFSLISRALLRRSLRPLFRFEQRIAELPARGRGRCVDASWGAAEINLLARTFNALLARTDAAAEREQRFVADAAHELRTPLFRLRGQMDLVLADVEGLPTVRDRLTRAVRSCNELTRTTEALLALARNQLSAEETVDLAEVVERACAPLLAAESVRLHLHCEGDALVRGDEALLVLATANLVDNALRYTQGAISVRTEARDGSCSVFVEDEGGGIPEDELAQVRQPFVRGRTHPSSARGMGLGLALVDHVAAVHRATLRLENRSPHGLSAEIRLPGWQPRSALADQTRLSAR